jgi:hypothetical protein
MNLEYGRKSTYHAAACFGRSARKNEGRDESDVERKAKGARRSSAFSYVGVREVVGRRVVFVVVLELFGRDGLAEVEGEGVEDVVLGRGEGLGLWQLAAAELNRTGGHFSFVRVSVLVFDEGVRTRVSAERTQEHRLVFSNWEPLLASI